MKRLFSTVAIATFLYIVGISQGLDLPYTTPEEAGFNRDSIENLLNEVNDIARKDLKAIMVINPAVIR